MNITVYILILLLIIWFIIYIISIFQKYIDYNEIVLNETLDEVKLPGVFDKLVAGTNVSHVIINGFIDINTVRKEIEKEKKKLEKLKEDYNINGIETQIEDLKKKSMILKQENDLLNENLIKLENEFNNIINSINVFQLKISSENSKKTNQTLKHIYSNIPDSFNIISGNSN